MKKNIIRCEKLDPFDYSVELTKKHYYLLNNEGKQLKIVDRYKLAKKHALVTVEEILKLDNHVVFGHYSVNFWRWVKHHLEN